MTNNKCQTHKKQTKFFNKKNKNNLKNRYSDFQCITGCALVQSRFCGGGEIKKINLQTENYETRLTIDFRKIRKDADRRSVCDGSPRIR